MSLILEALKKLEREKQAGERGLVVLSHLPWTGARGGREGRVAARVVVVGLILLAVAAGGIWQWRRAGPTPTADAPPSGKAATALPATPSAPAAVGAAVPTRSEPIVTPPPARTDMRSVAARPEAPATPFPFPAAPTPLPDAREIHLNAISVHDGHPVAILNDRLVREGDSFDGIRVLRIGEAEVEVEVGGVRRLLKF